MELGGARIGREPVLDERRSRLIITALVEVVGVSVGGVRVARRERERALDQWRAGLPSLRLGESEAVRAEEPPVVAVGGGQAIEELHEEFVSILTAAEADQAVYAGCRREHHRVARKVGEVGANGGKGPHGIAIDRQAQRLDVIALTAGEPIQE